MTLAQDMADFVVGLTLDSLPPRVTAKARNCLIYGYGVALGSGNTPYAPVARRAALAMGGEVQSGGATLLGDGRKTVIAGAALANAALFHGRAQEDTCGAAHLGAILIPLLTAMVEARNLPLDRLVPALVAGYECGGLLEGALARFTTPNGHRATALYGPIAATAAAARLMDLPSPQIAAAISNAASFAGGTLQSFADGTDEWRYHVGMAGHAGLAAAELAAAGSVSAPHGIEGASGFARAFSGAPQDLTGLSAQLGKVWAIERVTFKPFPVCAFNQTPVTAALNLRAQVAGRQISRVHIAMTPYEANYAGMASFGPFDSIAGTLMSTPYCVATTLLHGSPTMSSMTDYQNADVAALMGRTTMAADATVSPLCTQIEVELADGSRILQDERKTTADYAYERPAISELIRRIGSESGIAPQDYDRIEAAVDALPSGRIGDILAIFAPNRAG